MNIEEEVTTDNGKTYKLYMKDGELGYRWHGSGKQPSKIEGLFVSPIEAQVAMTNYLAQQEREKNKPSRLKELEECKNNSDLREFCKKYNFLTPDTTNLNARKKAIKEKLLSQGDKE